MPSHGDLGRKGPPHLPPITRGGEPIIIFLTVCTKNREKRLANPETHQVLIDWWRKANSWRVGRYVILPDHVHLFCTPDLDVSLERWVGFWKNGAARVLKTDERPLWQRDFWDTQIRLENYEAKWEYVRYNPVRHKLCVMANDWPLQVEIEHLEKLVRVRPEAAPPQ
jgi:REP element-mobilizing transposase RayT